MVYGAHLSPLHPARSCLTVTDQFGWSPPSQSSPGASQPVGFGRIYTVATRDDRILLCSDSDRILYSASPLPRVASGPILPDLFAWRSCPCSGGRVHLDPHSLGLDSHLFPLEVNLFASVHPLELTSGRPPPPPSTSSSTSSLELTGLSRSIMRAAFARPDPTGFIVGCLSRSIFARASSKHHTDHLLPPPTKHHQAHRDCGSNIADAVSFRGGSSLPQDPWWRKLSERPRCGCTISSRRCSYRHRLRCRASHPSGYALSRGALYQAPSRLRLLEAPTGHSFLSLDNVHGGCIANGGKQGRESPILPYVPFLTRSTCTYGPD